MHQVVAGLKDTRGQGLIQGPMLPPLALKGNQSFPMSWEIVSMKTSEPMSSTNHYQVKNSEKLPGKTILSPFPSS